MILKGATADQVSGWKEPWREGSHLRLCIQSWNLRDSGDGEHVGHLHDQQRGEHVPQANPRPLRLECSQHCLQHQGKIYCNIVDMSLHSISFKCSPTDSVQVCNTVFTFVRQGWTAACDDAVISCQPSPCYGELGNGDKKKSSAAVSFYYLHLAFLCSPKLRAIHETNHATHEK